MSEITEKYAGKVTPVVLGFLRFLEKELQARPGDIVPAGERQLKRIGKLVAGVKAG